MPVSDDEARELRDRLEAAQTQLKRTKQALLETEARCVALTEEAAFLKWSLEGGETKGLILALAESRAEAERLRRALLEDPQTRAAALQPPRSRVCVIRISGPGPDGREFQAEYVAFVIDAAGATRDLARSPSLDTVLRAAEQAARERGLPLEDLS